jgi:Tol biopolymer transport system component/DNA-binding winged helix-turn-helix (wHTH) protein
MPDQVGRSQVIRFATFEVDLQAQELRKGGLRLKLSGQPFQVLAILLEQPGVVVTREELQKRLWPDTFVDVDHNLNTAINKIREALGDSSENPRFVETLPRRGYRFVAPITANGTAAATVTHTPENRSTSVPKTVARMRPLLASGFLAALIVLVAGALWIYKRGKTPEPPPQRTLTRITFDDGLQSEPTWSPDGRYIAYSSDRGGKVDIWVQQISGGDPIQITKGPGHHWQPDWSHDGKYIAYRSENDEGGLYIVPALGGAGLERKISSFGYYPRWSPDNSQIMFRAYSTWMVSDGTFVMDVDRGTPKRVLAEFDHGQNIFVISAAWHPDGKRISFWGWEQGADPSFWTMPATGGRAIRSEIAPKILKQFGNVLANAGDFESRMDLEFSWSPSAEAIYFERAFRGARNLWKMSVDPNTLKATAIERLTTGPEYDTRLALSPDGRKLAFTGGTRRIRAWLFPFDATRGRLRGPGQAVTSPGAEAWAENLSQDGKKLAYCSVRGGKWDLWVKSLSDDREAPIVADDHQRAFPQWSPDGTRLAYLREDKYSPESKQIMIWSSQNRQEEALTALSTKVPLPFDWSPDGKRLLTTLENSDSHRWGIWLMPAIVTGFPRGPEARNITSHPTYDLAQPHYSPDGRWIVFEAIKESTKVESTLYVMPALGGAWVRVTEGRYWDDKPRWSPDGKTIYFVSGRGGAFNVWGIRFDPINGQPVGEAFQVTAFKNPNLMIPDKINFVELSLTQDKLVLAMEDRSGSIWVLDNVDR